MSNAGRWLLTFFMAFVAGAIQVLTTQATAPIGIILLHGAINLLPCIAALKLTLSTQKDNTWKWLGVIATAFAAGAIQAMSDSPDGLASLSSRGLLIKGLIAMLPALLSLQMKLDPTQPQTSTTASQAPAEPTPPAPPAAPGA